MQDKRTRFWQACGCRRPQCGPRIVIGAVCLLIALLLVLLCAPGWFTALLIAALLFVLGVQLLFRR